MTVIRIVPNVATPDTAARRSFYTEVLGLEVGMDMGWIVTFVGQGGPAAQLSLVASGGEAPHPDYSVEVDGLDDCYARAVAAGCNIVYPLRTEPWGVRRFFVRDPNGKVANIMTHR